MDSLSDSRFPFCRPTPRPLSFVRALLRFYPSLLLLLQRQGSTSSGEELHKGLLGYSGKHVFPFCLAGRRDASRAGWVTLPPSVQAHQLVLTLSLALILVRTQTKVREATSNDAWGPSGTQMNEIAQLTYNQCGQPLPPPFPSQLELTPVASLSQERLCRGHGNA
jgi:hypothetical protein